MRSPSPYWDLKDKEGLWHAFSDCSGVETDILLPFSPEEYASRWTTVRSEMHSRGMEALVLSSPESIFWLTNYQTPGNPATFLVVPLDAQDPACVFTRELEASNMRYRSTVQYVSYNEAQTPEPLVAEFLAALHGANYGYEASSARLTVRSQRALEESPSLNDATWQDVSEVLVGLRNVKSERELVYARNAAGYCAAGLQAARMAIKPGVSEVEVAGEILKAMGAAGGEYASYPIFLSSGNAGCIGHHAATRRKIREGECVFMEVGSCCHRYHASKMHTMWVGSNPPAWFLEAEALLKEATSAGRAACIEGATGSQVDGAMRGVVARRAAHQVKIRVAA